MTTPDRLRRKQQHIASLEADQQRAQDAIERLTQAKEVASAMTRLAIVQDVKHWRDDLLDTEERLADARQRLAQMLTTRAVLAGSEATQ